MVPYLRNVLWRVSCHKWLSRKKREPLCSPDCYGILILNLFTCCRAAAAVWGSYGLVSCLKVTSQLFVTAICWNNFCSLFLFDCLTSIFVCSRVFIKLVPSMPFDHRRCAETLSVLLHHFSANNPAFEAWWSTLPQASLRLGRLQLVDVFFFVGELCFCVMFFLETFLFRYLCYLFSPSKYSKSMQEEKRVVAGLATLKMLNCSWNNIGIIFLVVSFLIILSGVSTVWRQVTRTPHQIACLSTLTLSTPLFVQTRCYCHWHDLQSTQSPPSGRV